VDTYDEFWEVIDSVSYKDWKFEERYRDGEAFIRVSFVDGEEKQNGRWWRISKHATKSEIVNTCLLAVLTAEEHEAREKFRYKGTLIYGPHFDVDWLATEARKLEHLDVRPREQEV